MQKGFKKTTYWNRKIHIYTGLFLLWFIWLFSVSGLLLNHGKWKFAGFWDQRKISVKVFAVNIPAGLDSTSLLNAIMEQTKISGEVSEVKLSNDSVDFRVSIPGHERNLHTDLKNCKCTSKEIEFNWWGKIRTLHTFNGVNKNNRELRPNWIITRLWQFTMDAIAAGLIIICITSWITWFKSKKNLVTGSILLLTGFAIVIYFVFLIKIFY
jgi:hypothetical protein